MKIDAFILCFNEADLLRHTLNYYLKFCNKITIMDNESTDSSLSILKNEYPSVIIKTFPTNGENREDIQTEIKNSCWKSSQSEYVIVCDMDEFLYDESFDLKLKLIEKHKPALCNVIGYEMFSDEFPSDYTTSILDQVKHGIRNHRFDKTIIFNKNKVKEINYDFGAHSCNPEFYNKKQIDVLVEFKLLHYKYLSKSYLYKKHLKYAKRLSKINIFNTWGIEYRKGKKHINKQFKKAAKYMVKIIP